MQSPDKPAPLTTKPIRTGPDQTTGHQTRREQIVVTASEKTMDGRMD